MALKASDMPQRLFSSSGFGFILVLVLGYPILFFNPAFTASLFRKDVTVKDELNSVLVYVPRNGWMNDPNGLVYVDGVYHLFYQYNPYSDKWGNLSWGHAVGNDLVFWEEQDVALPFNETTKEWMFSGGAVYDKNNTSGFGSKDNPPVVATYTSYFSEDATLPDGSKVLKETQSQSIAYSLDKGNNWHFYDKNPIIKHPPKEYAEEYKNFRDPSVFWYEPGNKWVMVLVVAKKKKAIFYSSKNLINWSYMSEFSSTNSPDDMWECPNLLEVKLLDGTRKKWVMLMSTNPGSIAGGSGMHYYIGHFDGFKFTEEDRQTGQVRWLDYGSDFYAGVTWTNTGDDKYIIGWINNWDYSNKITDHWRGGQSLVRELNLVKSGERYGLLQKPIEAIKKYRKEEIKYSLEKVKEGIEMSGNQAYEFLVELDDAGQSGFSFVIEDDKRIMEAEIQYDNVEKTIILQKKSSDPDGYGQYVKHKSKFDPETKEDIRLFIDSNTLTLFLKKGETVFTELLISKSEKRRFYLNNQKSDLNVNVTRWLLAKP